jgi:hypothetical protein
MFHGKTGCRRIFSVRCARGSRASPFRSAGYCADDRHQRTCRVGTCAGPNELLEAKVGLAQRSLSGSRATSMRRPPRVKVLFLVVSAPR